jgi:hypothetical protein
MVKKKKDIIHSESNSEQVTKKEETPEQAVFGRVNFIFFGIGLLLLIAGYIALGSGSITLAPILLVGAYCIVIPIAILLKPGE